MGSIAKNGDVRIDSEVGESEGISSLLKNVGHASNVPISSGNEHVGNVLHELCNGLLEQFHFGCSGKRWRNS